MEPRSGGRLCIEGPPFGSANSRDWFRPEGFTALRVLTSQNPTSKKSTATWDHTYPTAIRTPFQDLVAIVSVQEKLNQTNENSGRGKQCEGLHHAAIATGWLIMSIEYVR